MAEDVKMQNEEVTKTEAVPEAVEQATDKGSVPQESTTTAALTIVTDKAKLTYAPGERLDLSGVRVMKNGTDVTSECKFSPENGSVFPADVTKVTIIVTHEGSIGTFDVNKKRSILPFILIGIMVLCIGVAIYFATRPPQVEAFPEGETGTYMIPQGSMTDEEAQALVNEMAEKSRITVSLAPEMALRPDGTLRVNLVVPEDNNGLSERIEVEQDGQVVYRSGVVAPGNRLEWGTGATGHEGDATATVYAVKDEADFGNPVSVEVKIVEEL